MGRKKDIFRTKKWQDHLSFECLGVKIGVRAESYILIDELKRTLPGILPIEWREIPPAEVIHWFSVPGDGRPGTEFCLYKNSEHQKNSFILEESLKLLETQIRSTVAEFARDHVFLHAGAVSWKGKAIVIPGKSFSGKTTLVKELIKRDCDYLSDEYAVIDREGFVHPFPKKLSLRGIIDDFQQIDFEAEELGGRCRQSPAPIGFILVTEYKKQAKKPEIKVNSGGEGVLASIANSISVRQNPQFVLEVLTVAAGQATVLQTERGEAGEFADLILDYLEGVKKNRV